MSTFLSIIILLVVCRIMMQRTWVGKTIILLFKTFKEMFKFIYLTAFWIYKNINNLNKKMCHENSSDSTSNNKVIDFKKRKQTK